jgi:hypothetical protein
VLFSDSSKAIRCKAMIDFRDLSEPLLPFELPVFRSGEEQRQFRGVVSELLARISQSGLGGRGFFRRDNENGNPSVLGHNNNWRVHIVAFSKLVDQHLPNGFVLATEWCDLKKIESAEFVSEVGFEFEEELIVTDPFTKRMKRFCIACYAFDGLVPHSDGLRTYKIVDGDDHRLEAKQKACSCLETWLRWIDAQPVVSVEAVSATELVVNDGSSTPSKSETGDTLAKVLNCISRGISKKQVWDAAKIVEDDKLSLEEKLEQFGDLFPVIKTLAVSYSQLGELFGVTKQRIGQTKWCKKFRKDAAEELAERRFRQSNSFGRPDELDSETSDNDD